ncbi:MAG TPA: hypothetical protein VKB18_05095 [Gemmatimonadota bacterium]|nr:hypothetical protein [Gemmatimonadota bacterium]
MSHRSRRVRSPGGGLLSAGLVLAGEVVGEAPWMRRITGAGADPTADIRNTRRIVEVFRGGERHER